MDDMILIYCRCLFHGVIYRSSISAFRDKDFQESKDMFASYHAWLFYVRNSIEHGPLARR